MFPRCPSELSLGGFALVLGMVGTLTEVFLHGSIIAKTAQVILCKSIYHLSGQNVLHCHAQKFTLTSWIVSRIRFESFSKFSLHDAGAWEAVSSHIDRADYALQPAIVFYPSWFIQKSRRCCPIELRSSRITLTFQQLFAVILAWTMLKFMQRIRGLRCTKCSTLVSLHAKPKPTQ